MKKADNVWGVLPGLVRSGTAGWRAGTPGWHRHGTYLTYSTGSTIHGRGLPGSVAWLPFAIYSQRVRRLELNLDLTLVIRGSSYLCRPGKVVRGRSAGVLCTRLCATISTMSVTTCR